MKIYLKIIRVITFQLFVHKLFGYRGVILFPWTANITEKSDESELNDEQYKNQMAQDLELEHDFLLQMRKNATAKKLTYYQVLIDNRDIPYMRMQPEAVTFLTGSGKYRSVYSVHGLDYVSQIDVLPYTTTEKIPIIHELYDKLLMPDSESSKQKKTLGFSLFLKSRILPETESLI